jgi:hypothetical protein
MQEIADLSAVRLLRERRSHVSRECFRRAQRECVGLYRVPRDLQEKGNIEDHSGNHERARHISLLQDWARAEIGVHCGATCELNEFSKSSIECDFDGVFLKAAEDSPPFFETPVRSKNASARCMAPFFWGKFYWNQNLILTFFHTLLPPICPELIHKRRYCQ